MKALFSLPSDSSPEDRRAHRRYDVALELRYKTVRGRTVVEMGRGLTCDLSSGGVAFISDQVLPCGVTIELWIEWPARLYGQHALRLIVHGRVVRSNNAVTAIRNIRHEFRTAGSRGLREGITGEVPAHTPGLQNLLS